MRQATIVYSVAVVATVVVVFVGYEAHQSLIWLVRALSYPDFANGPAPDLHQPRHPSGFVEIGLLILALPPAILYTLDIISRSMKRRNSEYLRQNLTKMGKAERTIGKAVLHRLHLWAVLRLLWAVLRLHGAWLGFVLFTRMKKDKDEDKKR